jgi:hypothetical protein
MGRKDFLRNWKHRIAIRTKLWRGDFLEKFPDSRYDRCNNEVGPLDIGFVDMDRIKLAKNRANVTALVLEVLNLPVLQTTNSLVVYQCSNCV